MNEKQWLEGLHHLDTSKPLMPIEGEPVFTLYMRDFVRMPNLDFPAIVKVDEAVRSLLN